jgi:hypothetical protein
MAPEEQRRFDLALEMRAGFGELRTRVGHLEAELGDVRGDLRRLDGRFFQLLVLQLTTLATMVGALVTSLAR